MTRATALLTTLCAVALAAVAATRLSFNVDLLDLLPQDLPEVQGLREFTERFSGEGELVVTLDRPGGEAEQLGQYAAALAEFLTARPELAERVEWRPIWEHNPIAAAELPAYLWINGDPERVQTLAGKLSEGSSEGILAEAIEELQFGFDGEALAFTAYDPFGLLRPPGTDLGLGGAGGRFGSADGTFRALYVTPPETLSEGYKEVAAWLAMLRAEIAQFASGQEIGDAVEIGFTGEPAFEAEIGSGMERDMTGSVIGAMALIHLLFFLMHRRMLPLVAMFLTLSMVLSLTVIVSSFWIGKLSVMSVGFAAILVGLTVDYGVVLYQEARAGAGEVRALRASVGSGILWAAVTTAAVFASLGLSALPGIRELGVLVGGGILVGAFLMLRVFARAAAPLGRDNPLPAVPDQAGANAAASDRPALWATGGVCGVVAIVLLVNGLPGFYASFDALRPSESSADDAYQQMADRLIDSGGDALPIVVVAEDYESLSNRATAAGETSRSLIEAGALSGSAFLPDLVPSAARQAENVEFLKRVLGERERLLAELGQDFGIEAAAILVSVFDAWEAMLGSGATPIQPHGVEAKRTLRQAVHPGPDGVAAMGLLRLVPGKWQEVKAAFGDDAGTYLTGWPTLGPAVKPLVMADVAKVFIPMAIVLMVMLAVVFRRPGEIALAAAVLVLSGIVLLALMRLAGWEWDFLNICAFPLLLGTGIDYTVHMIGALRRHDGDRIAIRRGIGRALLFCGASTAIGFGSLALAENAGLASLGRVCASGTLITMTVAVFLLPAWWRRLDTARADS